ncbi:MAG: hypothetical protein PHQ23_09445, partial [Candidatus Wallbacteria bacterium]|nr:hypothetical protein [Candidatus Wallbacteria bacterium]
TDGVNTVRRMNWYGLSLTGKPWHRISLWGEYTWNSWDEDVNIDADADNEDGETAFLAGIKWEPNLRTNLLMQYTSFDQEFFRPNIWDTDTYFDWELDYLYHAAGYRNDFDDLLAELRHRVHDKGEFILRYEKIDDNTDYAAGINADDRRIITGTYRHQYAENTAFSIMFRKISVEGNTATAQVGNGPAGVHGADGDDYGCVNLNTTDKEQTSNILVDDVTFLRLQLEVAF